MGGGWNRRGPTSKGDAYSEKIGSIIRRTPSSSTYTLAWPIQKARKPGFGSPLSAAGSTVTIGIGDGGTRTSLPPN